MTIRKKLLLVFFSIMTTIAAALVLFSQTVLLDKFINVEQKNVESELEQLSESIAREIINLSSTVKDYAVWDLTYQFTKDRNISFIDTNITQENFNNLGLSYWIITDIHGELLFSKENTFGQLKEISPYIISGLKDNDFLNPREIEKSGLVMISGQPILFATHAITTTDDPTSSNGMMVIGRILDDAYINNLYPGASTPLTILPYDNLINDSTSSAWVKNITRETPYFARNFDANTIYGYTLIQDIFNEPAIVVKLEIARSIYKEGRNTIFLFIGIITGIGWIGAAIFVWLNNKLIFKPIKKLQGVAAELSKGDFAISLDTKKKDEIGDVYRSFSDLIQFLSDIAHASKKISEGDLTITIEPQSGEDVLSLSTKEMVQSLCEKIRIFSENSNMVEMASLDLTVNATEANTSTSQITNTIQQVAHGITEQTSSVNKTASAVYQLSRAIHSLSNGAENQAQAVEHASSISNRIADKIQQVLSSIQQVAQGSVKASTNAETSSAIVVETVKGMQAIKKTMDVSSEKIHQMGNRSDQIADIADTIDDIASQTNLLALNAAIEAARAESQATQLVEAILESANDQPGCFDRSHL